MHDFYWQSLAELSNLLKLQTGQQIQIPEEMTTIGVTFDNTLISLDDFGIKSGRIIFDESFALTGGLMNSQWI
ncbi:MAG: hypothetical protein U5K71_08995 [Gracilimonas sp.]|nr:hypothetical protein [Gracilimonas sp.]